MPGKWRDRPDGSVLPSPPQPRRTPPEVEEKVLSLNRKGGWGRKRIAHALSLPQETVRHILRCHLGEGRRKRKKCRMFYPAHWAWEMEGRSGTPAAPQLGHFLTLPLEKLAASGIEVYFASVKEEHGQYLTTTSRSVALLGRAASPVEAKFLLNGFLEERCPQDSITGPTSLALTGTVLHPPRDTVSS